MKTLTTKEAMQALLDGKKIRGTGWDQNYYIELNTEGDTQDEKGTRHHFESYEDYTIYTPPKQKKKVTLYRYTYLNGVKELWQSDYTSVSWEDFKLDNFKLLKTETKEVEYE